MCLGHSVPHRNTVFYAKYKHWAHCLYISSDDANQMIELHNKAMPLSRLAVLTPQSRALRPFSYTRRPNWNLKKMVVKAVCAFRVCDRPHRGQVYVR
jgi:hypothetical protein